MVTKPKRNRMEKFNRIIFLTSLILLCLWIVFPIIRIIVGIEFASGDLKMAYKEFLFFAVPILMFLTLFGLIKKSDNWVAIFGKVIGTLAISLCITFFIVMSVFTDMCIWTNEKILFKNVNTNSEIILRNYSCGATDSSSPIVQIHKIDYYTKYFIKISDIDTNSIDKKKWEKVES